MKSCKNCGACCECFGVYELTAEDMIQVPKYLFRLSHLYPEGAVMKCGRGFRCIAYDDVKKCTIYKDRPDVCRRFQRGSEECEMAINHQLGENLIG